VAACDPARRSDLPVGSSPPPRPQPRPFFPFTPPPFAALTTPEGPVQDVPSPAARRRHARHGFAHLAPVGVGTSLGRRVAARTSGCAATRHQAVAARAAAASHRGRGAVVPTVVEAGVAAAVAPQAPCTVEAVASPVAGAATSIAAATTRRPEAATTAAAAYCSGGWDVWGVAAVIGGLVAGVVVEGGGVPPPRWAAPARDGRRMAYVRRERPPAPPLPPAGEGRRPRLTSTEG